MSTKKNNRIERVVQSRYDLDTLDMTKPLDISKFGSDEDPCFGKLYDLNTKQCKMCADADFCAIKMAQTQTSKRNEINKQNNFIEELKQNDKPIHSATNTVNKKVKKFMKRRIDMGAAGVLIRRDAVKKYDITREQAKEIYLSLK